MIKNTLNQIDFFNSLDEQQLSTLIEHSAHEKCEKGYVIFHQGDESKYLHILLDGIVQIQKYDDIGNPIIIGIFSEPSLFGEAATLKRIPFPSSALAKTDVTILKIKIDVFCKYFLDDINIAKNIVFSLVDKIQVLQRSIHNNLANNAIDKIIHFYENNASFANKLKQYEIASLLGVTSETLSRNMKKLVKEGVLKKDGNKYYLFRATCKFTKKLVI